MEMEQIVSFNYRSATCYCICYVNHQWNWEVYWDPSKFSDFKLLTALAVAKVSSSGEDGRWLPVVASKPISRGPASIDFALRAFVARVRYHAAVVGVDGCKHVAAACTCTRVAQAAGLPSADRNFTISAASLSATDKIARPRGTRKIVEACMMMAMVKIGPGWT